MKFEAKTLSPVAFYALTCVEVSVSIKCFDWSKMAAEVLPVARIDEYAKGGTTLNPSTFSVIRGNSPSKQWLFEMFWPRLGLSNNK